MSKNWIAEKWRPFTIRCFGSPQDEIISTNSVLRQFDEKQNKKINIKTKIVANVSADEFLKSGKLNLSKTEIKIEDPVFVHFEFDDFRPWNLKKSSFYESLFMLPPGRWKIFFTCQMTNTLLSNL